MRSYLFISLALSIIVIVVIAYILITKFFEEKALKEEKLDLSKIPKLVLAFYYAWYGNPDVSDKWVHWNHWIMNMTTRKIIGKHNPDSIVSGRRDVGAAHYPSLGLYDSNDESVILTHLKWAKDVGIDGFIVSWWGINSFSDKALKKILDATEKSGLDIKITVYYESVGLTKRPINDVIEDFEYLIKNYGYRPAFLKFDKKPVIFVYAVGIKKPEFWRDVFETLRKRGIKCIFIGDMFDKKYAIYFDGIHIYNPIRIVKHFEPLFKDYSYKELGPSLGDALYLMASSIAKKYEILLFTTVLPGYDDRKVRVPGNYLDRYNGYTYNLTWIAALKVNPHGVLICTWNEWHEGTEIEPSVEYGKRYLEITKYWISKFKGG